MRTFSFSSLSGTLATPRQLRPDPGEALEATEVVSEAAVADNDPASLARAMGAALHNASREVAVWVETSLQGR